MLSFRRLFISIFSILFFCNIAFAQNFPPLIVEEEDGTPTGVTTKIKVTDGTLNRSGTVATITTGGGTPGGSDGQPQYNNSGVFGGVVQTVICDTFTDAGINAAIDALGADGGVVIMPPGTYTITGSIVIDYDNTTLQGSGANTILDASGWSPSANIIDFSGVNGTQLKDFKVLGKYVDGTWNTIHGNGVDNSLIEGLYIDTTDGVGIAISTYATCSNNTVKNNYVTNSGMEGILVDGTENSIIQNIVYNCAIKHSLSGIRSYGANCIVSENIVTYCGDGVNSIFSSGIRVQDSQYGIVTNNTCNYNDEYGIHIRNGVPMVVTNNTCNYNRISGILADVRQSNVSNNSCFYNNINGTAGNYAQIELGLLYTGLENTIMGNMCRSNGTNYGGIHIYGDPGLKGYSNILIGNDIAGDLLGGIWIGAGCDGNQILNNVLAGVVPIKDEGTNTTIQHVYNDGEVTFQKVGLMESGATPTYHTILQSADLTGADSTYTLPTGYPAVTGYVLSATDAGAMSWIAAGGAEADTLATVTARGADTTTLCQFQASPSIELGKDIGAPAPNIPGLLKFWGAGNNAYYTTITAPTQTASADYTLPVALPAGTYLMTSTSAGVMAWLNPATDTFTQYAKLQGRASGQTLNGGTQAGESLILVGTSTAIGVSGYVKVTDKLVPTTDNTYDLGFNVLAGVANRWKDLYLSGNLSDGTNTLTVANAKTAYTHSQIGNVSPHVPTGTILMFGGAATPTGYLPCDGAAVSEVTYAALFAIVGYNFGNPGGGNFNVPDMQLKFPKGVDTFGGMNAIGDTGGSATHTHTPGNTSNSAGTPAGTISWPAGVPTFTGTLATLPHTVGPGLDFTQLPAAGTYRQHTYTPQGSVAWPVGAGGVPTFAGAAMATHTHTPSLSTDNGEPAYLVVGFIIKY